MEGRPIQVGIWLLIYGSTPFAAVLKIADEYERLAERAAQRLIDDTAGAK